MEQIILTEAGYSKLKNDLNVLLKEKLPELVEEIKKAQDDNNCSISENTELLDALSSLDRVENKIKDLDEKLRSARIIKISDILDDGKVRFGSTVKLLNIETDKEVSYMIVGAEESDVKAGKISYLSPLAKELMGQNSEDYVECVDKEYKILSVKVII